MVCFTRDQLRGYLRRELPAVMLGSIDQHIESCSACCRTLDALASDSMVRDFLEASRREASQPEASRRSALAGTTEAASGAYPTWQPFNADAPLPLQFGRFTLKRVLGSGGFGVVYLAEDADLEREVAVKIPHLGGLSPDVRRRFLQEGTAAAGLHHPHIVQVHQSGAHRGVCFLVSEYCPGRTLRQLLRERHAAERREEHFVEAAARIILKLAEAAEHAHQNGVVHRDIKPANVILDERGARDGLPFCPKLTDFGTAKFLGASQSVTSSGLLIGTAPYMAPEQISSGGEVGPACDIYALGVLLYELVAGRLPLEGSDSGDTIRKVVSQEPFPLHRAVAGIPRDLSAICACCLEKNPSRRYASAGHLARDLERFLNHEPTAARPLGPAARLFRWSRRNPLPLTVMAAITLVFALAVLGLAWHSEALRTMNNRLREANRKAVRMKDLAEQSEIHARRLRYASDIRLAEKSWREGDPKGVREILARHVPQSAQPDFRGFEWHFLRRAAAARTETVVAVGSPLYCIGLSPDGEFFATAGQDSVLRIYERSTGTLRRAIRSGQGEVNGLAFSPDGRMLASTGDDGSFRLWRVADGKPLNRLSAHDGLAFGVAFTRDAERLVTCGSDGLVHVWKDGQKQATYRDHRARVEAIAVSADGRWFASVGKDRALVVRAIETGQLQFRWDEGQGTLASVAFAPDSSRVAVVEASGETKWLRLFDLETGSLELERQHPDGIRSVAFSPDGDRVLTSDNVGIVRIWDVASPNGPKDNDGEPREFWHAHDSRVHAAVFEPGGDSLLSVGQDGRVRRSDRAEAADRYVLDCDRLAKLTGRTRDLLAFHNVAFHPDGRQLLVSAHSGIAIVHVGSHRPVEFQPGEQPRVWVRVATSSRGPGIAVGGSSTRAMAADAEQVPAIVEVWDAATELKRRVLMTRRNCNINDLCFSPAGDILAVVLSRQWDEDAPKQLLLLDPRSGEQLGEFPAASGTRARITRDGRRLVYGIRREIRLVDLHSRREQVIHDAHTASMSGLSLSGDGKWLATCDEGRELKLWNLETLQPHAVMPDHQGSISALEFSADCRSLLSSSHDGTVKVWSVASGQLLMDLHRGSEGVNHMALSPDGTRLAVVEGRERIRLYHMGGYGR